MLSTVAFMVGVLFVVAFYGYVFAHLYREHLKHRVSRASLDSHVSVIKVAATQQRRPASGPSSGRHDSWRNENLLNVAVAVFGLVGLFGEIFVLNGLLASSH